MFGEPLIVIDSRSHSINFGGTVYVQIFMDEVINDKVVPMFQTRPHLTYIWQRQAPCCNCHHKPTSRLGIPVILSPAKSPDLCPIEHVCDEIKKRPKARSVFQAKLHELWGALNKEWDALLLAAMIIARLKHSMRSRCLAAEQGRGGHSRYSVSILKIHLFKCFFKFHFKE